jgi:hypothetical protein
MCELIVNARPMLLAMSVAASSPQPSSPRAATLALKLISLLSALLAIWPGPIEAHNIYTHLKNRSGKSCCDNTDCRPVPYRVTSLGVEMLVGETWVWLTRGMVQYRALEGDTGETNGGHWCGERYGGSFITRCAFLPPNLALLQP